jgi:hypothetical protein
MGVIWARASHASHASQRERPRSSSAVRQRERTRRYRQRLRDGCVIAPVPVTDQVIALLLDLHWLAEGESEDRQAIGEAIARMLKDTAKNR